MAQIMILLRDFLKVNDGANQYILEPEKEDILLEDKLQLKRI